MDKRQKGYEAFIAELQKQWQETEEFQGERLNRMIAKVQAYLEAASDLTQDELALMRRVREAGSGNYDEGRKDEQVEESCLYAGAQRYRLVLAGGCDRPAPRWSGASWPTSWEHKGVYEAGDWVGLGVMVVRPVWLAPYRAPSRAARYLPRVVAAPSITASRFHPDPVVVAWQLARGTSGSPFSI